MKNKPSFHLLKKLLIAVLFTAATAIIYRSVSGNLELLQSYVITLGVPEMGLAILLLSCSIITQGLYNMSLIFDHKVSRSSYRLLLSAYFVSKLVRYVPGKIWGIYYQSEKLRDAVPAKVVWSVNLIQFFDANLLSAFVILSFLVYLKFGAAAAIIALLVSLLVCFLVQKAHLIYSLVVLAAKVFRIEMPAVSLPSSASQRIFYRLTLLFSDWLFFIGAWLILSSSFMPFVDGFNLAIIYASASLIGLAVVFMPSGLVVREASFIAIASWFGYEESLAVLLSILARLLLTIADVFVGIVFIAIANLSADRWSHNERR